jgi:hypothetical protein
MEVVATTQIATYAAQTRNRATVRGTSGEEPRTGTRGDGLIATTTIDEEGKMVTTTMKDGEVEEETVTTAMTMAHGGGTRAGTADTQADTA